MVLLGFIVVLLGLIVVLLGFNGVSSMQFYRKSNGMLVGFIGGLLGFMVIN